jgi:hypothetical protein
LNARLQLPRHKKDEGPDQPGEQSQHNPSQGMSQHVPPVLPIRAVEIFRGSEDIVDARKNAKSDAGGNQHVCQKILNQEQSEKLSICAEVSGVDSDGTVEEPDQENDIDTDPFALGNRHSRERGAEARQENDCDQDQNPSFEADVFPECFAEHDRKVYTAPSLLGTFALSRHVALSKPGEYHWRHD